MCFMKILKILSINEDFNDNMEGISMSKKINTAGVCIPHLHFMVNITNKINKIKTMVDSGDYFVMNRPRQYGKTTLSLMI